MRCIVVDDEKLALELMEDNVRKLPNLELVGVCKNAMEAMELLRQGQVDLIFLDIQMPGISGVQFLKGLVKPPMVILVTAYENYALEGFNLDVVDYLVKPFSFERFLKAVNKAAELSSVRLQKDIPAKTQVDGGYIFVNADYSIIRINLSDIIYIEGLKDYIKIYLKSTNRPVITRLSMHFMESKLPVEGFARVHRSFIVSLDKITVFKRTRVLLNDVEIPVSDNYRERILAYVGYQENQ
jgi:DNA-binding LytR/AlgR family response regulator